MRALGAYIHAGPQISFRELLRVKPLQACAVPAGLILTQTKADKHQQVIC